jgi:LuxR family maltose regulon positive regulatory protein
MGSSRSEILRYKFIAPTPYPGAVWRSTLLERLLREPAYRLVLIQAPAGHGKSTLLQQARTVSLRNDVDCGWLSFDEADNDSTRFWTHVQAVVNQATGQPAPAGTIHGSSGPRQIHSLSNKLAARDRHVRLFFDEFQAVIDEELVAAFRDLLDAMPTNVTVYIGTRAMPDLGMARRIVNNEAVVLHADDLRFSTEETSEFFRHSSGAPLTGEELVRIHRQTDGWPAALQLFRLSLGTSAARAALDEAAPYKSRELADYLAQTVLRSQPPDIQHFMRVTSVLKHLTAPLCDMLTGRSDSQKVLPFLERSGLFLRCLDPDTCWFRYHTVFSSHLADELRRDNPQLVGRVHRLAAEWFQQEGLQEEAFYHAVAAGEFPLAADIMTAWSERLIVAGHLSTVERWADELPPDLIARRPDLAVRIAWAFVFLRRHDKLRALLPALESSSEHGVDSTVVRSMLAVVVDDMQRAFELAEHAPAHRTADDGSFAAFELGAATNARSYRALAAGDIVEAHDLLLQAHSFNLRGNAAFSEGYSGAIKGVSLLLEGRLQDALTHYNTALPDHLRAMEQSLGAAALAACYVHALYEAGDLDTAALLFQQYRDLISGGVLLDFLALGYTTMVRLHDARGEFDAAEQMLLDAEQIGHTAGWSRLLRIAAMERARRLLISGNIRGARKASRRARSFPLLNLPQGWNVLSEIVEGDVIGRIRIAVHRGQTRYALVMLEPQIAEAERKRRTYRLIKLLVLEALAYHGSGRTNFARRRLLNALQLAAPGAYVRLFADEGERLLDLLGDDPAAYGCSADSPEPGSVAALVSRLVGTSTPGSARIAPPGAAQLLEPLTEREKNVLAYLVDGASNGEVAKRIFVSENTVKFHLKNIYSKLSVSNRMQAITAARQLSLLP